MQLLVTSMKYTMLVGVTRTGISLCLKQFKLYSDSDGLHVITVQKRCSQLNYSLFIYLDTTIFELGNRCWKIA